MQSSIEGSGVCNWAAWWWAMGWVYQAMSSEGWNGNSYLSCGYISLFLIHYLKVFISDQTLKSLYCTGRDAIGAHGW